MTVHFDLHGRQSGTDFNKTTLALNALLLTALPVSIQLVDIFLCMGGCHDADGNADNIVC